MYIPLHTEYDSSIYDGYELIDAHLCNNGGARRPYHKLFCSLCNNSPYSISFKSYYDKINQEFNYNLIDLEMVKNTNCLQHTFCIDHFNEIVTDGFNKIGRLIGFACDIIDIYYIILLPNNKASNNVEYMWLTGVTRPYTYKDKLSEVEYKALDNLLTSLGCEPEKEFVYDFSLTS